MREPEVVRAIDAAVSVARAQGVPADDATVLQSSNKLALRLLPGDVAARVATVGDEAFAFEIELAQRLAETGGPAATLEVRVEPRVWERDGFAITLWTFYDQTASPAVTPVDYAHALEELHAGMRTVDLAAPHFTDRVAEAQDLIASRDRTPALTDRERDLVDHALRASTRAILERGHEEQLLHGEPHPGNVLGSVHGPRFIDFETCCRGPVEFDVAHVPEAVSDRSPIRDRRLLDDCRLLVLAMVAAWRCNAADQFPDGERARRALISALREGPPWPTADAAARRATQ